MKNSVRALLAATAAGSLALTACSVKDGERPVKDFPSISVSPESVAPLATADASIVSVVDSSPGGPKDSDPLWQGLEAAATQKKPLYLNAWVHYDAKIGSDGQVTLTPDTPESVSITLDAKAVKAAEAPFYQMVGTFTVTKVAGAAYTLKTDSTEEKKDLNPTGPSTKERCSAADAGDRLQLAAQTLSADSSKREEMHAQWAAAPAVWWAIQRSASSLRDSNGESQGDFFTEACEKYIQAG